MLLGSACGGTEGDEGGLPVEESCELGAVRCDGAVLMLCIDEGTNWAALQVCASPELCDTSDPEKLGCQEPGAD
jgi:hypothetical protein